MERTRKQVSSVVVLSFTEAALQLLQKHTLDEWKSHFPSSHSYSSRACLGNALSLLANSSADSLNDSDRIKEKLFHALSMNPLDRQSHPGLCLLQRQTILSTCGNFSRNFFLKSSVKDCFYGQIFKLFLVHPSCMSATDHDLSSGKVVCYCV